MKVDRRLLDGVEWLIPVLVMAPLWAALTPGGLPNTADGPVHLIRAAEMVHAWQDGLWLPRWAANLGIGYGLPLFVYAPPLPYLLTAYFHTLGLPLDLAYKAMLLTGVSLTAFGGYALSRAQLGRWPGAVGAAAFLYAPIVLRELFIQGNAAQFLAWSFIPWAALGVLQLFDGGRPRSMLLIALALVGALLSHNVVALLLAGMVAALSLFLALWTRRWSALGLAAGGGLLGLMLSAWFWLPALFESHYVRLDRIVASDFRSRFIPLAQLVRPSPRLDTGAINPDFPLTLGAVQVWLAVAGAGLLIGLTGWANLSRRPHPLLPARSVVAIGFFFLLFAAFGAWMATAWSEPLWARLPFADLFEWPFRWHGFTAVGLSWLCACAVWAAQRWLTPRTGDRAVRRARLAQGLGAVALLLLIGSALVNLYPRMLPPGAIKATPADIVRYEERTGAIGATSLGEFNPMWAPDILGVLPVPPEYRAGAPVNRLPAPMPAGSSGAHVLSTVQRHEFQLSLDAPATLTLRLLYFPGWQATLDGAPIPVRPHEAHGLIELDAPAGDHKLTLIFGDTPLRRGAGVISLVAWSALVGMAAAHGVRRRRVEKRTLAQAAVSMTPAPAGGTVLAVSVCVALLMGARWWGASWLQTYTPPGESPPAAGPPRATFGDQLQLLGVEPPPTLAHQGETIELVTYWRAQHRLPTDYAIFLHLDDPSGETVAATDHFHPADIPTSTWGPALYVRAPLRVDAPLAALPIRYDLRVGVVEPSTGEWIAPATGPDDALRVGQIWVAAQSAPDPPPTPQARFGEAIYLLGARYDPVDHAVMLYWQAGAPVRQDYTIFVHAVGANGEWLGQIDAAPYDNRYATADWRPQQVIEDRRVFGARLAHPEQMARVAVGLYDPQSGDRLPITQAAGAAVADNALLIELAGLAPAR